MVDAVDFTVIVVQISWDADERDSSFFWIDIGNNHGVHKTPMLPRNEYI